MRRKKVSSLVTISIICDNNFSLVAGEMNSELRNLASQINQFVNESHAEEDRGSVASSVPSISVEHPAIEDSFTAPVTEKVKEKAVVVPVEPETPVVIQRPTTLNLGSTNQPLDEPEYPVKSAGV